MSRPKGLPKTGGRVKGTPNKACPNLKELAQTYTYEAIKKIAQLMRDPKVPEAVQLSAAQTLLDRGWGRPAQAIAVSVNLLEHMSDEELAADIERLTKERDVNREAERKRNEWIAERTGVPLIELHADKQSAMGNCQDVDIAVISSE